MTSLPAIPKSSGMRLLDGGFAFTILFVISAGYHGLVTILSLAGLHIFWLCMARTKGDFCESHHKFVMAQFLFVPVLACFVAANIALPIQDKTDAWALTILFATACFSLYRIIAALPSSLEPRLSSDDRASIPKADALIEQQQTT